MKASQISKLVLRAADVATEVPAPDSRTFGDKAKEVLSNRYVLGGLAAVAVAGAAYGTYRGVQAYRNRKIGGKVFDLTTKKGIAAAEAELAKLTPEEQIAQARSLLTAAETNLKAAGKAKQVEAAAA